MKKLLTLLFLACGMATGLWASSIPGALSGRFTINASGEKVLFSQGNLQYQASTNTWRFATNQYDYIGSANSNISDSYTGWIDLFGWGTGNNPTLSSWTYTDYSTFVDWGTNTISNGGNTANEWFSLSVEEWTYIFNTRDNACNLRGHSTVNGVNGYVILPDGFIIPDGLSFTPVTEWGSNVYNEQQWAQMETAGAVFFPASGCRASGKTIGSVGDYGGYYSCSNVNDNNVYNMSFGTSWAGPDGVDTRCYGRSVRLVRSSLQQDAEGYYLLGSADDWKDFAAIVNSGTNAAANAKMTADIDLGDDQTMVGTISVPYQGSFDGQGHTLTVNYDMTNYNTAVAPFACVGDATIQNLHVDGSIIQRRCGAGGVAGTIKGNLTVSQCWVSAYMYVQGSGNLQGTIGGIASYCDDPNVKNCKIVIEDCLFSGHLGSGYHCGGLMSHVHGSDGYNNSAQFNNCLNIGTIAGIAGSTGTFIRTGVQGDPYTITNCYYQTAWGGNQGTQATSAQLSDGTTSTALQNGRAETVWVQDPLTNQPMLKIFAGKNLILGDANDNGEVEIGDVTSVLTLMATPEATGYNNQAADANGNGEIEIGDVTTILTIMAGGE